MKLPGFVRLGMLAGVISGTSAGAMYIANLAYNDDQIYYLSEGVTQYAKVDGIYAHTILTKGDQEFDGNYIKVERKYVDGSKTYIGIDGCSCVDEIIIKTELFGTGPELKYERVKDGVLKEYFFNKADEELEEQCRRFLPLMKVDYLP